MFKHILENIGGIESYGMISIVIFFAFFSGILLWAGRARKQHLDSLSTLPLHDGTDGDEYASDGNSPPVRNKFPSPVLRTPSPPPIRRRPAVRGRY